MDSGVDWPVAEQVYIANIVKCCPPQNRKPLPDEAAACMPYLHRQIALIRPKVILALEEPPPRRYSTPKRGLGDCATRCIATPEPPHCHVSPCRFCAIRIGRS
jgi:uracil-DNA glycosylase